MECFSQIHHSYEIYQNWLYGSMFRLTACLSAPVKCSLVWAFCTEWLHGHGPLFACLYAKHAWTNRAQTCTQLVFPSAFLLWCFHHAVSTFSAQGINFNSDRIVSNSLRSHCLLDYAATVSAEKQNALAEALFQGHFSEGNKISSTEFLLKAVGDVGFLWCVFVSDFFCACDQICLCQES